MSRKRASTCSARRAAELVGYAYPGKFNNVRKALQKVLTPSGEHVPYPTFHAGFDPIAVFGDEYDPRVHKGLDPRRAEAMYCSSRVLVVPAWGGIKVPGTEWVYDEALCATWRERVLGGSPPDQRNGEDS